MFNIRLTDFGLADEFGEVKLTSLCGSPNYASPEMIQGKGYDFKTDIWSIGIVMYILCYLKLPFEDDNIQDLYHKIVSTEPDFSDDPPDDYVTLIKWCLKKDPSERPTIK